MSEPTREQIEAQKRYMPSLEPLCDMALRTHDAEQRAEQAEAEGDEYRDYFGEMEGSVSVLAQERDQARQEAANLREALEDANGMCRSAAAIARRENELAGSTNWPSFEARLSESLERQHAALQSAPPTSDPSTEALRREAANLREAFEKVAEIYFNIAAEVLGEDEVRRRREERIEALHSSDAPASEEWCICADPENCTESIPGKLCKRTHGSYPAPTDAPASEPEYEHLGDYSAVEPWHRVFMSCDRCKVTWDGCWDNYQCPRCGEGDLPWQGNFLAPADRPEQAWCQPRDDQAQMWVLIYEDPDRSCDVFRDEAQARAAYEQARQAWTCRLLTSVPYTADRPEPSEALEALEHLEGLAKVDALECGSNADAIEQYCDTIRQALSQPAPAVPSAVRRLPGYWRMVASNLRSRDRYAVAEGYHSSADDLERALAAQPSDSPAVPDEVRDRVAKELAVASGCSRQHVETWETSDHWLVLADAALRAIAAATEGEK